MKTPIISTSAAPGRPDSIGGTKSGPPGCRFAGARTETRSGSYTCDGGNKRETFDKGTLGGDRLDYEFSDTDCSGKGHFDIAPGGSSITGPFSCSDQAGIVNRGRS